MKWICWLLGWLPPHFDGHNWETLKDDREMNLVAVCRIGEVVCRCKRCNAHIHVVSAGYGREHKYYCPSCKFEREQAKKARGS